MTKRRVISFNSPQAVAEEVKRLRPGCTRAGNWSLPQVCRHLNTAIRFSMRPGPYEPIAVTPESKSRLAAVLAAGQIPPGIKGPERAIPPQDTPDGAIDEFLITLAVLEKFPGPYAPHPFFGEVPTADFARLHLIHCALHLGHLVPVTE